MIPSGDLFPVRRGAPFPLVPEGLEGQLRQEAEERARDRGVWPVYRDGQPIPMQLHLFDPVSLLPWGASW